jgi:hypothetical protein
MKKKEEFKNNLNLEIRNGAVILYLEDHYAILTPDQAEKIGATMGAFSYEARTGSQPHSKAEMMDRLRAKLVTRCSLVISNLQEKQKNPYFIADAVVDIILSEAL